MRETLVRVQEAMRKTEYRLWLDEIVDQGQSSDEEMNQLDDGIAILSDDSDGGKGSIGHRVYRYKGGAGAGTSNFLVDRTQDGGEGFNDDEREDEANMSKEERKEAKRIREEEEADDRQRADRRAVAKLRDRKIQEDIKGGE